MNEIITIHKKHEGFPVNARELWEKVQSKQEFVNWIKGRIEKYGFIQGKDFLINLSKSTGGRPATEYWLTINMGKELAMVEENEAGKAVRNYLIQVEENYQLLKIPQDYPSALRALADQVEQNQKLLPKAESFDSLISAEGLYTLSDTAKILNYENAGPKKMFKVLEDEGFLFKHGRWHAKQNYIDWGYFVEKTRPVDFGNEEIYTQVFVTPKGLDMLDKHFRRNGFKKNKEIC